MSDVKSIITTQRQRDTIMAALRLWQSMGESIDSELVEIAENDREGDDAALSDDEIDELIEQNINI